MRRDNIFWGGVLILFGVLFLLQTQGFINNVFRLFWPILLMLVGGWMVMNVFWRSDTPGGETFIISLGEAKQVRYKFSHGAAQIRIHGNAPTGQALVGTSAVATDHHSNLTGDILDVKVNTGPSFIPVLGPSEGAWHYQVTKDVPATLTIEAGASTFEVDLKDTLVSRVELKVGASTVDVTMPAHGSSALDIEGGAATFNVRIPEGTAARIDRTEGFVALNVDTNRFPASDHGYQSPNFDTAADRVSIAIKAGVGTVNIK
jgi:cell wall-active antibiotic response 4TMS protein YvqF